MSEIEFRMDPETREITTIHRGEETRNSYERVREFHETFGHPIAEVPSLVDDDRFILRIALILEEFIELLEACGFDVTGFENVELRKSSYADLVEIADALGDIEYVVNGAALEMGINLPEVVKEIHRSNMTKLGPDGKPIYREDGKILKGEDYEPPNISRILWK